MLNVKALRTISVVLFVSLLALVAVFIAFPAPVLYVAFVYGFSLLLVLLLLFFVFKKSDNKVVAPAEAPRADVVRQQPAAPAEEPKEPAKADVGSASPDTVSQSEYDMRKAMANTYLILCAVNGIRNTIRDEHDEVRKRLDKLSNLVYYMYYSRPMLVPLRKEIENMRTYLEFQRLKMRNNLEIKYVFPQKVRRVPIQSLTLLPFLSDIFRNAGERLKLNCRLAEHEDQITFQVTYSAPQSGAADASLIGGNAFDRLRQRLNEKYEGRHEFSISRTASSTSITIVVDAHDDCNHEQADSQSAESDE